MRIWTVHVLPSSPERPQPEARAVLLREGFSWPAFLVPVLWLAWHRLWLFALGYLVVAGAVVASLPDSAGFPVALALQYFVGVHARDLRRRALARRGYVEAAVIAERDEDGAMARLIAQRPDLAAPMVRTALA
jgi:hypothetical protein